MAMTDWKMVADELYMYLVGRSIGMEKDQEVIAKDLAHLRRLYDDIIKANTKEKK